MIAILGSGGDPVCAAVTAAAAARGLAAVRIENPSHWSVSVTTRRDRSWRVVLNGPAGSPTSILNRGLPPSATTEVDADQLATWWAALALFGGRVLNRPDSSGFLPQVFLPSAPGSAVFTGPDPALREGQVANVYDVADGRFRYRLPGPETSPWTTDERRVRTVTRFDPAGCWRLMAVGDRRIDVALPVGGLGPSDRAAGHRAVAAALAGATPFALVVLDRIGPGDVRVIAIDPMPGIQHYAAVQAEVHSAVVDWLTS